MNVRLQKVIAAAGVASRRKAEKLISDGMVTVNGKTTIKLGVKVDPAADIIAVAGKKLSLKPQKSIIYALYKPRYCLTTMDDPLGRETIVKYFPKTKQRLFPVGRLDYDAEGLILITNDGDLANNIIHPAKHIWKRYFVKIKGKISEKEIRALRSGPIIDHKKRQPVKIQTLRHINDKTWLTVELREGLKNHIKKMFNAIGCQALKIKRYSIGNIELRDMSPGETKLLSKTNIQELLSLSGQPSQA